MKIAFFGTPDYVIPVLDSLHKEFKDRHGNSPIIAVVTQSPKPVGRSKKLEYSAVDTWAHKKHIPVYFDSNELIADGVEADLGIVAAYGAMIPDEVLKYFPKGVLNIHPSNLPEFRGASPIQAMLITGKEEATVSIMEVDAQMDHGLILTQFKEEIRKDDTTETLRRRLFERSAEVLLGLLDPYLKGKITVKPQDDTKAVYTRLIKKEDGFIPFEVLEAVQKGESIKNATQIPFIYTKAKDGSKTPYSIVHTPQTVERFIRTMNPWPGAWTEVKFKVQDEKLKVKRLKIREAHIEDPSLRGTKQSLLDNSNSILIPDLVQLEGKNPVSWKQFTEAYQIN